MTLLGNRVAAGAISQEEVLLSRVGLYSNMIGVLIKRGKSEHTCIQGESHVKTGAKLLQAKELPKAGREA